MKAYKEFSKLIKKARKELGITQIDLASSIGICQSNMFRIEQNQARPLLHNAVAICKVLDIDLNYLTRFVRTYKPKRRKFNR